VDVCNVRQDCTSFFADVVVNETAPEGESDGTRSGSEHTAVALHDLLVTIGERSI
jgi:hypothetical protein